MTDRQPQVPRLDAAAAPESGAYPSALMRMLLNDVDGFLSRFMVRDPFPACPSQVANSFGSPRMRNCRTICPPRRSLAAHCSRRSSRAVFS